MCNRFSAIDMRTTTFLLRLVKRVFPEFEFTWLGEEMEANLPLEMDFRASPSPSLSLTLYSATSS